MWPFRRSINAQLDLGKYTNHLLNEITRIIESKINEAGNGLKSIVDLSAKVKQLQEQVSLLTIQKSQKEEEFARERREIEHKVGLVKLQQEAELEIKVQQKELDIERKLLGNERIAFEEKMTFMADRFKLEVEEQRKMIQEMLKRLPSAEILAKISNKE